MSALRTEDSDVVFCWCDVTHVVIIRSLVYELDLAKREPAHPAGGRRPQENGVCAVRVFEVLEQRTVLFDTSPRPNLRLVRIYFDPTRAFGVSHCLA